MLSADDFDSCVKDYLRRHPFCPARSLLPEDGLRIFSPLLLHARDGWRGSGSTEWGYGQDLKTRRELFIAFDTDLKNR